ncbi:MAG: hypothetical protein LBN36_04565 [Clostridiales Family XIII bacterium]|jgi:hypothetical protein|nr:hypothetical protein [Clostridiales Family XIII bacterium]
MPNHITNEIRIEADPKRIHAILESIKNDLYGFGTIDFNKIIPVPQELNIRPDSYMDKAIEIYAVMQENGITYTDNGHYEIVDLGAMNMTFAYFKEQYGSAIEEDPAIIEFGHICHDNKEQHGAASWYEWCQNAWGTRWNAFGFEYYPKVSEGMDTIMFDTAWSGVPQVLAKLSQDYPETMIHYRWAGEDIGNKVGMMDLRGGTVQSIYAPPNGSMDAQKLACDIMRCDPAALENVGIDESEPYYGLAM